MRVALALLCVSFVSLAQAQEIGAPPADAPSATADELGGVPPADAPSVTTDELGGAPPADAPSATTNELGGAPPADAPSATAEVPNEADGGSSLDAPVPLAPSVSTPPMVSEHSGTGVLSNERPSALARGELVAWHTIGGATAGALVCALAECERTRGVALSILGLGAVGGGLALAFSRDGVRPGRAALHGAALRWGYLDTWLLSSALGLTWREREYSPGDTDLVSTNGHVVALMIGHGLGLGGALLADHFFAPTAGDVGLMDSLHKLSAATVTLVLGAADAFGFESQSDVRRALLPLLFSNAVALGLGGWLTTKVEMTRGRSLLLDLGMVLGVGLGVGVPLLIAGDDAEPEMLLGGGAAGVVVGFTSAWLATRRMRGLDDEASNVDFAVAPTMGGAQASLQVRLR